MTSLSKVAFCAAFRGNYLTARFEFYLQSIEEHNVLAVESLTSYDKRLQSHTLNVEAKLAVSKYCILVLFSVKLSTLITALFKFSVFFV